MKALTFFSNVKSKSSNDTEPAVDLGALQNSVLTKRNARKVVPKTEKPATLAEKTNKPTEKPARSTEKPIRSTEMPIKSTEKSKN